MNHFQTKKLKTFLELPFIVPPRPFYEKKYSETIMKYISSVMVDRTETFKDCGYPNVVIEQPIPTSIINPGDFSLVVDKTAKDIIEKSTQQKKPIAILYSGGMDSTCVAAAFLKHNTSITIVGSKASIDENPVFYNEVLVNNKNVILQIDNPLLFLLEHSDEYIFVTGECGAHLMGTINWTKYGGRELENIDAIEADHLAAGIFKNPDPYFNIPHETREMLLKILEKAPKSFKTNYDAQWWAIFALKWQFVAYRTQLWIGKFCPTLINFYMNDDFQNWALYNDVTVKCPNFEWRNYKMPIKDYIFSYFPNRASSYDLPKRASMERTYISLHLGDSFVLHQPKQIGFLKTTSQEFLKQSLYRIKK